MRELDPIRRLAPPVEPLAPQDVARIRARALGAPRRRRRNLGAVLAPVVVAACAAVVVVLGSGADPEVPAPAGPAQADGAPRLLLPGWTVVRVDEWKRDTGEMTFARDGRELTLAWAPTSEVGGRVGAAKEPGTHSAWQLHVTGEAASVFRYRGSEEYTAVWRHGATTVEARGGAASADAFAAVVAGLERVDDATWRRALPASAVAPPERGGVVDAMLEGLPRPPGLDVARLRDGAATRDRYQLGAQVAGAVACGWIAEWADAKTAGDDARVRRATAALASSRDWPVLREMDAEGDYPEVVWQYADAVAGDGTVMGGKRLTVEESYRAALCS